jgi:hypothetical protein
MIPDILVPTGQSVYIMPLQNIPQKFNIALAGKNYVLTCRWNDAPEAGWVLDFDDADSGTSIVSNIPLITGIDILAGLEYLGFGGSLIVYTDGDQYAVSTIDSLGVESNLYFLTSVPNG